eukprot:scaffold13564_cov128-Alexandrium_tamarense.AAC.15
MPSTKNASASLRKTVKAVKQVAKMTSETLTSFPPEVVVEKDLLPPYSPSSHDANTRCFVTVGCVDKEIFAEVIRFGCQLTSTRTSNDKLSSMLRKVAHTV